MNPYVYMCIGSDRFNGLGLAGGLPIRAGWNAEMVMLLPVYVVPRGPDFRNDLFCWKRVTRLIVAWHFQKDRFGNGDGMSLVRDGVGQGADFHVVADDALPGVSASGGASVGSMRQTTNWRPNTHDPNSNISHSIRGLACRCIT